MNERIRFSLLIACLLAVAAPAAPLHAEPTAADKASARDFMHDGKALRAKGDHAGALKKFLAAWALVPSPVTGLAVAREHEALGQWVEAREVLGEVQRTPPTPTESAEGKKAREEVSTLLSQLVPKIPVLEIVVQGASGAVTLEIDGKTVPAVAAQEGVRVNPGKHLVVARVAGAADQQASVTLEAGQRQKVTLKFSAPIGGGEATTSTAAPAAAPPATSHATEASPPAVRPPIAPAPSSDVAASRDGSSTKTIGLIVGAAGVLGMGVGGALALSARAKYLDARDGHCVSGLCDDAGKSATDDARSLGNTATVIFALGAVATAGGVVLWLTAPSAEPSRAAKPTVTGVGVGAGTLSIVGRF